MSFANMVSDYLVALQMLREALWPSEKEVAEAYVNEYLNEVQNYVDFPVYMNVRGEEYVIKYDNWYLAIERLREEVVKIYKRDSIIYLGDYVKEYCPSIILDYRIVKDWNVTGVNKHWVIYKMTELYMKDVRGKDKWEMSEIRRFTMDVLYYVVTIEE